MKLPNNVNVNIKSDYIICIIFDISFICSD